MQDKPASPLRHTDSVRLWILPPLLAFGLFYILPLGKMLMLSVDDGGFTFKHYEDLFTEPAYVMSMYITVKIAVIVTVACLLIGYPIAYLLRNLQSPYLQIAMIFVLIPFWTSVLVRSYAWIALLSRAGVVNKTLLQLGIIETPIQFLYNELGVIIGMTYVLLPMMILCLYASMVAIQNILLAASESLGARRYVTFASVFLPLSIPGIWAGSILVFVTALGFFITPVLLGGGRVPTVAVLIDAQMHGVLNWGLGSALSVSLLMMTILILLVFERVAGVQSLLRRQK